MTQPIVLVLAGGASTRFWPLRDKLFIELGGQSLLGRHLRALRELGCERFVVVTRPDTAASVEALGRSACRGRPRWSKAPGTPRCWRPGRAGRPAFRASSPRRASAATSRAA